MKVPGIQYTNVKFSLIDFDRISDLFSLGLTEEEVKLLSEILSAYPFTFFEKENFRKKIDTLPFFFWIKNRFGFCNLVNQRLASYFNFDSTQIEDNHEENFFSTEDRHIIKSFNQIAIETKKAVRLEGIEFADKGQDINFDLINVPIVDTENTVVAIITFSVHNRLKNEIKFDVNNSLISQFLTQVAAPAILIDNDASIRIANREFHDLLAIFNKKVENSTISCFFSENFVQLYYDFLSSDLKRKDVICHQLFLAKKGNYKISLGKIFEEDGSVGAIILTILNQTNIDVVGDFNTNLFMENSLIKYNPDVVLVCDKENLRFLEVNDKAISLYGYSRDEFLKMDLTDLYSTEDIQLLSESARIDTKEGIFYGPYKHKRKDGSTVLVEMSSYSIKFNDKDAHFNIIRNIAETNEDLEHIQFYKTVVDNIDDLFFYIDNTGQIKQINLSVTKYLGYTKNELINFPLTKIILDEDRGKLKTEILQSVKQSPFSTALSLKSIEGRKILFEIFAIPIIPSLKSSNSFVLLCRRKESLKEGGANTNKDYEEKESRRDIIDSQFMSSLFHELLTPINVILGFSQELVESNPQAASEQKEVASYIQQNRAILLQSMNSALEYVSLLEPKSQLNISELKITDMVDLLVKDANDLKNYTGTELAYGRISSSLKFESDSKKFRNFLALVFNLAVNISGQNKIYFSSYPLDKEKFIVTFRDSVSHSSQHLVQSLKEIFLNEEYTTPIEINFPKISIELIKKELEVLRGVFKVISDDPNKFDYYFVFPVKFPNVSKGEELESKANEQQLKSINTDKATQTKKVNEADLLESKLEALRQKIRKKETEVKSHEKGLGKEESSDEKEEPIRYIDVDLQESSQEGQEEIEIIETTPPKEKEVETPLMIQTDEKVDLSKLSCLYFEDQIDSQILFSVQMKGLKNLNFAVSFEEGLPLLESGNYDFILVDINLHGSYNGLDILKILRRMPKYENTPIFAATAYSLPGDQSKFVLAGFNGFISKPIFRDQMIDLLAEVFNQP